MAPTDSHATASQPKIIGPSQLDWHMRLCGEIRQWLEAFSAAVRARDYEAGQKLFAVDVYSFGTRAAVVQGLDQLVRAQWEPIWSSTRGYHFQFDQLCCGGDGEIAWAAVPWQSQGQRSDGSWFDRSGRATFILQHGPNGWRAVHSHHSLEPV